MKKLLAILMALSLTLAFTACSGDNDNADDTSADTVNDTTDTAADEGKEVIVMTYADYVAAELESEVVIEAYVQAKQSWWDNKATVYTQDQDGAYFIFEMTCSEADYQKLVPGTKIRVTGYKTEWSGEIEIASGSTFEFIEGDTYIAEPIDLTDMLGTDDLINYQNQLATFKGLTVESVQYKNGTPGDDIYVTLSLGENSYEFCLEYYLNGDSEIYHTIGELQQGDIVDVDAFVYWYEGVNPHITAVTVVE